MTDRSNPLVARVWVNRIWHYHFGRGIVATPGDFGVQGAPPSNQPLLDWLATELIDSGWSTKHIHRLIVLSNTYRQSARPAEDHSELDSENEFLWHWTPRRLEAEAIRDSILFVSGQGDGAAGGRGDDEESSRRRSVYLLLKRDDFPAAHRMFDGPTADESCSRRHVSTVALQPLYLLNDETMNRRAVAFARRVIQSSGVSTAEQIETAFRMALAREPSPVERRLALAFLRDVDDNDESTARQPGRDPDGVVPSQGLIMFCHGLLNLNEFVYLQ